MVIIFERGVILESIFLDIYCDSKWVQWLIINTNNKIKSLDIKLY